MEKSVKQRPLQDLRCQSGQSAKDSVIFSGGDSPKSYGTDQQRLQISDFHFDKFPSPATFACWKIRFKTEVCTCSQFPTEAMQWIKEVEIVDSVDDLKSSSSMRGIQMPNFEALDARIASALSKIIHNSHFKRRISLEEQKAQKQGRFLRGIDHLMTHFRVPLKQLMIPGPCQETSYTAITLNPESSFTRRERNHSISLKYIDVSRTTHTNLDVKQEKRIDDYWKVDGSRDLSDICWILGQVSHNLLYWKKNLQTDTCGPGRDQRESS